jgi:ribosome-associated protein
MSRKFKKGYFVQGHFVAEGSELDVQLKAELKGTDSASRTDLKRESIALQDMGEQLLGLRAEQLAPLNLPEKLQEALTEARRITNFEGKRRQVQFIGKLMRKLEDETVALIRQALADQHGGTAREVAAMHQAEQWRDSLLSDDGALARWMDEFPATDAQQLRSLVRQARKDAKPEQPGQAPRHGRAYREIFQLVRTQLIGGEASDDHDNA